MSVVQQLQMQEMNFSLKMEDKYLRQLGGFVDLLHFCIQSLGSMYIIEVLLPPLAVVLLFWFYFSLSYLCLTDILIDLWCYHYSRQVKCSISLFFPFILQRSSAFVIVITKLASCTLLLLAVCSTGWVFSLKLSAVQLFSSGSSAFLSLSVIDAWQGSRAEAIQTWLLC